MAAQGNSVSRLAKLQLIYQNKQKEEMERRRNELINSRDTVKKMDGTDRIQIGNGKVRQMFDERRHRVTGIDKSYPLLPISSKFVPNNSGNQYKNTINHKRSFNQHLNADMSLNQSNRNGATSITSNSQSNRNILSSKFSDVDYIEDEKTPDIFSQLDDIDTLDSGRRIMSKLDKQIMNSKVTDNKTENANNMKLGPVITRKTFEQRNSANALNTVKKLSPKLNVKVGSISIKSEKTAPLLKKGYAESSRESSASSVFSTKQYPRSSNGPAGMSACKVCGRNFNKDRIEKHESICKRTTSKKRKVFDITKHRVQGTGAEVYVRKMTKTTKKSEPPKKNDWRRKHEELIEAIRNARKAQQHLAKGGKLSDLPPPPASSVDPSYIQCPSCKRNFNRTAGERHIPKCANYQFNKPKPKNSNNKK